MRNLFLEIMENLRISARIRKIFCILDIISSFTL